MKGDRKTMHKRERKRNEAKEESIKVLKNKTNWHIFACPALWITTYKTTKSINIYINILYTIK